jgi:hypothetical protein
MWILTVPSVIDSDVPISLFSHIRGYEMKNFKLASG